MSERLFLLRKGVITGPFPEEQLQKMFLRGELAPEVELSPDKENWRAANTHFAELLPPEAMPDPVAEVFEESPKQEPLSQPVLPVSEPMLRVHVAENFWKEVPCKVITLLWNAPDAEAELLGKESKRQMQAGLLALLLAALLGAFCNALFAGRYATGRRFLWIMSFAVFAGVWLLSWGVIALCNSLKRKAKHTSGDFLAASALALECAGFHVIVMALCFLLNPDWSPTRLRLALPLFLFLLFGANFALNAFGAVRQRLISGGGFARYSASAISLVWNVILAFIYIEGIIIPILISTGVLK